MTAAFAPAPTPTRVAPRRDAVTRILPLRAEFEAMGVGALYLFGSIARDDAGDDSDIDVFLDVARRPFDLATLAEVGLRIEDVPARQCGVVTRKGLNLSIRERVERDAIPVF